MNPTPDTPKPRILIVEDEAIVALDLQCRLESLNYDVIGLASSGEQAVKMATNRMPDLVLMDIKLQGNMNGVEAAEKLRGDRPIPVIFLTATAEEEVLHRAKLVEPLGYLLKPYQERDLRVAIEVALYKARMERDREQLTRQLEQALAEAKILRGLIPICSWCRKVRSDDGFWLSVEAYLEKEADVYCSHSICPQCSERLATTRVNAPPKPS